MRMTPGGTPGNIRVELREGGKTLPGGEIDKFDDIGRSYFTYNIEKIMTEAGPATRVNGIRFYAHGKGMRPQYEASRLLRDALDHAPQNALFDEDIMTMDALYLTLREMVKRPKAKFSIDPKSNRSSRAGQYSRPSKLAEGMRVDAMLKVFTDLEDKLIKQGKISAGESLNLRSRFTGGSLDVQYNKFTISDFKAAVPLMLGFDDWEQMSKHLDEGDDVVNSVIDLEQGIF